MGFKKIDPYFTSAPVRSSGPTPVRSSGPTGQAGQADLVLKDSMDKNRCLTRLMNIAASIDWNRIESILMNHYQVGGSKEGAEAYPPILLFKCLLLQKWFHLSTIFWTYGINIDSDPELESQVNNRISFKKFLGLSFNYPSPDHSTFSRFRKRLSKNAMDQVTNLRQSRRLVTRTFFEKFDKTPIMRGGDGYSKLSDYERNGYGYTAYDGTPDYYGISISIASKIISMVEVIPNTWVDNHEVLAISRRDRWEPWICFAESFFRARNRPGAIL